MATLRDCGLANAVELADFFSSKGEVGSGEHNAVTIDGKTVGHIHIGDEEFIGPWTIWPAGDFSTAPEGFDFDDKMKEIAWSKANICGNCGCDCAPGSRKAIFGKEFDEVCAGALLMFNNPEGDELECVKKLAEMALQA